MLSEKKLKALLMNSNNSFDKELLILEWEAKQERNLIFECINISFSNILGVPLGFFSRNI